LDSSTIIGESTRSGLDTRGIEMSDSEGLPERSLLVSRHTLPDQDSGLRTGDFSLFFRSFRETAWTALTGSREWFPALGKAVLLF
jgi:hypothetical protein